MSMLPDIDHTRSIIGKLFYPLAAWLNKRFGHRTITHSFIFLIILFFISAYIEKIFSDNLTYSIILIFAITSHLILDMITMQGVPAFYPFYRNPCVIPANPVMRINIGNKKAETIFFCITILLMIGCVNLFKNGFWTSYNRAFGTLKHVHYENISSSKMLYVEYNYLKNNKDYSGTALLVDSHKDKITLFDEKIFLLSKTDNSIKINSVKPYKSDIDKIINEISFLNISYDSLNSIIYNKIVSGNLQCSKSVEIIEYNIKKRTSLIKLNNAFNPGITFIEDSTNSLIYNEIDKIELKLKQEKIKYDSRISALKNLKLNIEKLKLDSDSSQDLYLKNKYQNEIISLNAQYSKQQKELNKYIPDPILLHELKILRRRLHSDNILFSGVLTFPYIPDKEF
jgi:inner membrane protein